MINRVVLLGRICTDVALQQTNSGKQVVNFTMALDRGFGSEESDFIKCTAWEKTAEFVANYFGKGRLIGVDGRLETRRWTDKRDGTRKQELIVVVDQVSFTGEKRQVDTVQADAGEEG